MDWLLAPQWLHVIMHIVIFAGLAILLSGIRQDGRAISMARLAIIVLVVGFFQELFQYLGAGGWHFPRAAVLDSIFDLAVDQFGAFVGLFVFNRFSFFRKPPLPVSVSDYGQN